MDTVKTITFADYLAEEKKKDPTLAKELEAENGKLIFEKEQEQLTITKLFENYNGESFDSELIEFEPIGNELW